MQREITEYLSEYKYRIELHAHSNPCSDCSRLSPVEIIQRLKEGNYDAVVITNHFCYDHGAYLNTPDPIETYMKAFYECRDAGEKAGIRVLLGAEYRFLESNNDYLVFGIDEAFLRDTVLRSDLSLESFYKEFHSDDILIIQAHPCRIDGGGFPANPEFLDGMEIMNMHNKHISGNGSAAKYASENNIPVLTVGTDVHVCEHVGLSALKTKVLPKDEKELVKVLRSRDYIFEIGGHPMLPYITY